MKVDIYKIEKKFFNRIIGIAVLVNPKKKIEDDEISKYLENVDERIPIRNNGDYRTWRQNTIDLKRKDKRLGIDDCSVVYDEIKNKGYFVTGPYFTPQPSKQELLELLQRITHIVENMGEGDLE